MPETFADRARAAAGAGGSPFGTALALERHLRENYRVATGAALPTGHGYAQLDWFLRTSRRGTSEQFATAYVVLARSLGLPVRLVVGFRQPAAPDADGFYTVRNRDVLAWPEIHLDGPGWVPMDPTARADTAAGARDDLTAAIDQARKAPTPAPSDPAAPGADEPEPAAPPPPDTRAPAADPLPRVLLVVLVILLVAAVPAAVPLAKLIRARRRRAGDAASAVAGAVAEARDRLRDHGVPVPRGATILEVAGTAPLAEDGRSALRELATCADRALWSRDAVPPATAERAWQAVATVRAALRHRPLPVRLRAAVHPGSLSRGHAPTGARLRRPRVPRPRVPRPRARRARQP
jgi:hypothetical protein